jgi:hypothetical protein
MLSHFTKTKKQFYSIIQNGFLFLHCETGILGPMAKEVFSIDNVDDASSGMICFTEIDDVNNSEHIVDFGMFGIGLSKQWVISQGAKKVNYITVGSEDYHNLAKSMEVLAPTELYNTTREKYLTDPKTRHMGKISLTKISFARNAGANVEYLDFLETFDWMQTNRDVSQQEWRIRNPHPYAFTGRFSKEQQAKILINAINDPNVRDKVEGIMKYYLDEFGDCITIVGGKTLSLRIPSDKIEALFCPLDFKSELESQLELNPQLNIPIYTN